jgi:hypothetical protein
MTVEGTSILFQSTGNKTPLLDGIASTNMYNNRTSYKPMQVRLGQVSAREMRAFDTHEDVLRSFKQFNPK